MVVIVAFPVDASATELGTELSSWNAIVPIDVETPVAPGAGAMRNAPGDGTGAGVQDVGATPGLVGVADALGVGEALGVADEVGVTMDDGLADADAAPLVPGVGLGATSMPAFFCTLHATNKTASANPEDRRVAGKPILRKICGGMRIRTADPLHAMQMLYQLSYTPRAARRRRDFRFVPARRAPFPPIG